MKVWLGSTVSLGRNIQKVSTRSSFPTKFGNPLPGKVRMYPEDGVQSIISTDSTDCWIKNNEKTLCRGALVFAFAPL